MTVDAGLDDEGVSAERVGLLPKGGFLPLIVLRCLLGASEAICRTVDMRCIRGKSGDLARSELRDEPREDGLRRTMKP